MQDRQIVGTTCGRSPRRDAPLSMTQAQIGVDCAFVRRWTTVTSGAGFFRDHFPGDPVGPSVSFDLAVQSNQTFVTSIRFAQGAGPDRPVLPHRKVEFKTSSTTENKRCARKYIDIYQAHREQRSRSWPNGRTTMWSASSSRTYS